MLDILIQVAMPILMAIVGVLTKWLWSMQAKINEQDTKIAGLEAWKSFHSDQYKSFEQRILDTLDRIENKIDKKADR